MTKIINLYGGPGTGKSTSATYLFYKLKTAGVNAELVREYVKDWAWEGRSIGVYDQLYFLGKQIRRESMLYGKVDWIVTDSPVLLSMYYAHRYSPPSITKAVEAAVRGYYAQAQEDGYEHFHVFLNRSKAYNPAGRFQTEQQARLIDAELGVLLYREHIRPIECGTDDTDLDLLLSNLRRRAGDT